jgi:hypothetical protein
VSELEHWLESGAPADIAEWLEAARAEQPSRRVVERSAALAATAVVTTAATASGAALEAASGGSLGAAAKGGALVLAKWGLAGMIAGSAVAGGSALVTRHYAAPPEPVRSLVATTAVSAPAPARELRFTRGVASVASVASSTPPAPTSAAAAPSGSAHARAAAATSSALPDARMSAELLLLERAQASADAGDTSVALRLLNEHDRRFGANATLSPEARYLKLEVLRASGRAAEAQGVAREILTRDADGPHTSRARQLLREETVIPAAPGGD